MVEYLMMRRITKLMGITVALLMQSAQAEILKDPTQPPASLDSSAASAGVQTPAGPVLQSVMIGAQYRAAIINGQKVLLGKKYEQATLIKLNESEAVLRNPDGTTQTLAMAYGVEKKVLSPIAPLPATKHVIKKNVKHSSKSE